MGLVRYIADGLINAMTGQGTSTDPRAYNRYLFCRMDTAQIEAAFRASWLMRKIITKPATEMVREWRNWQADKAAIEKLEAEEKRLGIRAKFEMAEVMRGLGGAGMVLHVAGDDPMHPIDPERIAAEGLTDVHVWHHSRFTLGEPIETWGDPWFGHPSYYELQLRSTRGATPIRFHPSRIIAFRGEHSGGIVSRSWDEEWWGDSIVQIVKDAVDNVHTGEDGFAALIKDARNRRIGVPKLLDKVSTAAGEAQLAKRMKAFATGESMYGVTWLDSGEDGKSGETVTDRQMTWTGIPDIKASNLMVAAAAARIPATVLLEKAPDGMNSTGDGDRQNWEKEVKSRQDLRMRPCMDQLDVALVPSALGKVDATVWWEFAPLSVQGEKDEATTFKTTMEAVTAVQNSGSLPAIAFEKAVQNLLEERGWMPGLGDALADMPKEERFPSLAEPDETDPSALQADPAIRNGGKEVDPKSAGAGGGGSAARRRAVADATPRTLYGRRDVVNVADFKAWAKAQGLPELQDGLHVTIAYSRTPMDWMKIDSEWNQDAKGEMTVTPGGVRIVEPLGDRTAVLLFTSSQLTWRHEQIVRAGASHDYDDYQPHISLTGEPADLSDVEPYRGKIVLGPEIFEELKP